MSTSKTCISTSLPISARAGDGLAGATLVSTSLDSFLNKAVFGICISTLALSILALTGCLESPSGALINSGPGGRNAGGNDKKAPPPAPILSINDLWVATSRTCNGAKTDLDPTEGFSLDSTSLVRIAGDTDSSTSTQFCEDRYLYVRTPTQSGTANGTYTEDATLASDHMIRDCFRISKGHVIRGNKISSEATPFGPEAFSASIVANAMAITLTLHKPGDCLNGDLVFTLKKFK